MKIVINRSYGGLTLSEKAFERLIELGFPHITEEQEKDEDFDSEELKIVISDNPKFSKYCFLENSYEEEDKRTHPLIIRVVEELGKEANRNAKLEVIEISDDVKEIHIDEINGIDVVYDWDTGDRLV